jgi:2-phosphosulfolactate phosphatase
MPASVFDQSSFEVRFEWGVEGLILIPQSDVVIVVDVLSFSTAVDVATSRGGVIYPARWKDERAAQFAHSIGATIAVSRSAMSPRTPFSLSPASFSSVQAGQRIVLPSPNGATVALEAANHGLPVIAGCIRNSRAVAQAALTFGRRISVIAAGERWPNGTLRPAVEDLVGAGAIIANLGGALSPEAVAALGAFNAFDVATQLASCASGRELLEAGFPHDIQFAAMLNASENVPLLEQGAFIASSQKSER